MGFVGLAVPLDLAPAGARPSGLLASGGAASAVTFGNNGRDVFAVDALAVGLLPGARVGAPDLSADGDAVGLERRRDLLGLPPAVRLGPQFREPGGDGLRPDLGL